MTKKTDDLTAEEIRVGLELWRVRRMTSSFFQMKIDFKDPKTTLIEKARTLATAAHAGQLRKYTGEPYIVHPEAVVGILRTVGADDEMLAAAWLHDVVEDTKVTAEMIATIISPAVAALVLEVTDVSKPTDGRRAVRKALDREHLAKSSARGATIKLADMLDNTATIVEHDPDFAPLYLREKAALLTVLRHGNRELWRRLGGGLGPQHTT